MPKIWCSKSMMTPFFCLIIINRWCVALHGDWIKRAHAVSCACGSNIGAWSNWFEKNSNEIKQHFSLSFRIFFLSQQILDEIKKSKQTVTKSNARFSKNHWKVNCNFLVSDVMKIGPVSIHFKNINHYNAPRLSSLLIQFNRRLIWAANYCR